MVGQFHLLERMLEPFAAVEDIYLILDRLDLCEVSKHFLLEVLRRLTSHISERLNVVIVKKRIFLEYDKRECCHLLDSGVKSISDGKVGWDRTKKSY